MNNYCAFYGKMNVRILDLFYQDRRQNCQLFAIGYSKSTSSGSKTLRYWALKGLQVIDL